MALALTFINKPKILATPLVTKEDPSWGTTRTKTLGMISMVEEKGYYEHLNTFLEDTVLKRREIVYEPDTQYETIDYGKIII